MCSKCETKYLTPRVDTRLPRASQNTATRPAAQGNRPSYIPRTTAPPLPACQALLLHGKREIVDRGRVVAYACAREVEVGGVAQAETLTYVFMIGSGGECPAGYAKSYRASIRARGLEISPRSRMYGGGGGGTEAAQSGMHGPA